MIVFWKVQAFNRRTKERSNKWLRLDTETLDPILRHKVELCLERHSAFSRSVLCYRNLFQDTIEPHGDRWIADGSHANGRLIAVDDYAEDEESQEIGLTEITRMVTGNPDVLVVPPGMRSHDVELYYLAKNSPLPPNPLDHIHLTQEEVDTLAYFLRDSTELVAEHFYRNPPSLHAQGGAQWLETIPVENIRSFVIVFRRMYMDREPGNYLKACEVYTTHFLNKRVTDWVVAEKRLYEHFLGDRASLFPGLEPRFTFNNKCLIDAFLYTKFIHQPQDRRIRQFHRSLQEVGNADRMEFACYNAMLEVSRFYARLQWVVSNELPAYLRHTGASPSFECPPFVNEGGRGICLTKEELAAKQLHERAESLGYELWKEDGRPEGKLPAYIEQAEACLRD